MPLLSLVVVQMTLLSAVVASPWGQEETSKPPAQHRASRTIDSYMLARGPNTFTTSASVDEILAVQQRLGGDFLWARRRGRAYRVRDAQTLDRARAAFDRLKTLDPEREALRRLQTPLEQLESRLDREEEALDREADRSTDDREDGDAAPPEWQRDLEQRRESLGKRRRALEAEQRRADALENALDGKEEALEKVAEAELWKVVDDAIARGLAEPLNER